jgi:PAS domain S-box-containing protein
LVLYVVAVLATIISLVIRWLCFPFLVHERPFITFFPAIILSAYLGGFGPGLLATILGSLLGHYFLTEPIYTFEIHDRSEAFALALFGLTGAVISVVTESLHRSRRRVAASERRYAVTLASIGDAVIATDIDKLVTYLNPIAESLTGWQRSDAVGRPLAEVFRIVSEQTRAPADDLAAVALGSRTVICRTNRAALLAFDGREVPVADCASPIIDDRGQLTGVVLVFRDVSRQRQAEEAQAFRRANERMELAVRGSNVGVWDVELPEGANGRARRNYVNVWEQLGYADAPEKRSNALAEAHPDDRKRFEGAVSRYLAGESAVLETEIRFRHKDGSYRTMLTRGTAVRDAAGKPTRLVGIGIDISKLKLAEEALRDNEQRWRSLTEALPQLVWSAMPDGACDYFSTQWTEHTGVVEADLLGWGWMTTLHPEDRERTRHFWLESVAERHPYDIEYRVRRRDGEYRWFKTRGLPIRDANGNIVRWFGTCTDITDLRQTEEALRRAMEVAEAANRAKDEFLANVSHEIRTPMNAILGMTELALETELSVDQRQCLTTVKSAADNLLGILNDLLDFAKIESGKMELDPADFSLRAAVGDTARALAARAHKKGLELICHVQSNVPDALIGDAGRLRQILLNLVGNAVKFTDAGEVVVSVESEAQIVERNQSVAERPSEAAALCMLRFTVRDTGIGISPDKQAQIFRAFEQEDTSTTRKYGGTGLGLTIASRLVALMGGAITVESLPNRGSTFAFTARFGLRENAAKSDVDPRPVVLHDLPVLVVDDNATNRHILEEFLRGWRMNPKVVADGVAAMDALWHGAACGRPYDLVLLDARMPDVDGLVLAARIRERAELSATRIILLTSADRPGELARLRILRVNAHLLKPVQQEELLETIHRVMSRSQGESASSGKPASSGDQLRALQPASPPLRILVAEDNEFNAQLLEELLERRDHRVRVANNGREALRLATAGGFDLVFLDLHMPEMDGFEVIRALREHEKTAGGHLTVIALTARSRIEDRERCLAAGMDDFLAKPIRAADLWAAIGRVTASLRGGGPPRSDLLDPRVLLAACGDDAAILDKMCLAFRARLPEHLQAVRNALLERNSSALREAAHKLAGMISAFSTVAGGVASELEDQAAEDRLEEAAPLVAQLETMAAELMRLAGGLSLESLSSRQRQPTEG